MKTRIFTWIITLGAFLNEAYAVLSTNQSILSELGVPDKVTRIIMLAGLLWTAFSKSLAEPKQDARIQQIGTPNVPKTK